MTRLRRALALWLPLLLAAAAATAVWRGVRSIDLPLNLAAPLVYKVVPGVRFARVAADLAARGVLAQPRALVLYARWQGLAARVKAGEYLLLPQTTPRAMLEKMVRGEVLLHSFTIIDGWQVRDLLRALRRDPNIETTLPLQPVDLMAKFGAPQQSPEGQFLPETYRFAAGATDIELLQRAHAALTRELAAAWKTRDTGIALHDPQELLIVASIVQKESSLRQERREIAGLYLHRLAIGMRLQADPTVIYGLGERYDGSLHSVDLRTDGPYNTYTRAGLPPTPIALPGAAAIQASANPHKTDALYFVASGKSDGSHVFSATLQAQNAAVARYLARLRRKHADEAAK